MVNDEALAGLTLLFSTIGWRYEQPGNQSSQLISVNELEFDEEMTRDLVDKLTAEAKLLQQNAGPLIENQARWEELQALITGIRDGCSHRVFNDEAGFPTGFPQHTRTCASCDAYLGTV